MVPQNSWAEYVLIVAIANLCHCKFLEALFFDRKWCCICTVPFKSTASSKPCSIWHTRSTTFKKQVAVKCHLSCQQLGNLAFAHTFTPTQYSIRSLSQCLAQRCKQRGSGIQLLVLLQSEEDKLYPFSYSHTNSQDPCETKLADRHVYSIQTLCMSESF